MRTILFTGKGGVGKTTIAAATAIRSAQAGNRTMIMSTDPAHSLADVFDLSLSEEPKTIFENLDAQQFDAQTRMEDSWSEIKAYLMEVFNWAGLAGIEAEELSVFPGLDELFALTDIKTHADSGKYDVLIVDCAPTAETIRLLSLPDLLSWYMDKVFPLGRRINRVVGPILSKVATLPIARDEVFAATQRFYDRIDGVKSILSDAKKSSVRLVINPEKIVIAEARRTYTYLSLYGYQVDAVIANRLIPDHVDDPFFSYWKNQQAEHMDTIRDSFDTLPIFSVQLAEKEPVGFEALGELAQHLYREESATDLFHSGTAFQVIKGKDGYVLRMEMPFTEKEEIDIARNADELFLRVGPYRRCMVLPDSLIRKNIVSAELLDGALNLLFV